MTMVYIVRAGETNEELRYSLRTVQANTLEDHIVIVGHAPSWLRDVEVVKGNRFKHDKARNVYDNIRIACSAVTEEQIILMNDDFHILRPLGHMPMYHRGSLRTHIASLSATNTWWRRSLRATELWLEAAGYVNPLSYELHRPFPVDRQQMAKVLKKAQDYQQANPPQWRTLYGNYFEAGGIQVNDEKVYKTRVRDPFPVDAPFLSTTDYSFVRSAAGAELRKRFPDPSKWEVH